MTDVSTELRVTSGGIAAQNLTRAQPAPANVVERVARAIGPELSQRVGEDWTQYTERLATAALSAIPVSGEVERLRELAALATAVSPTIEREDRDGQERFVVKGVPCGFPVAKFGDHNDAALFVYAATAFRQSLTPPRSIRVSDLTDEEVEGMRKPSA